MSPPLPASTTKHLPIVYHQIPRDDRIILPLTQISSEAGQSTGTTGTTLWLGAQVLSAYLGDILPTQSSGSTRTSGQRKRCLDLGSGVGYLPLCMAAWGWDVLATDIEPVVSTVLRPNVQAGLEVMHRELARKGRLDHCGDISVVELDWNDYVSPQHIAPDDPRHLDLLPGDYIDLIITSDTLYTPSLTLPLWSTLTYFARRSQSTHPKGKFPDLYIALENRDPVMIVSALEVGKGMGWTMKRVADTRVQKGIEKAWGTAGEGWKRSDWEGVEVWKGKLE